MYLYSHYSIHSGGKKNLIHRKSIRNPELLFYAGSELLEGPHWDAANNLLYCVSVEDCMIYTIDPETGEVRTYLTDDPVPVGCAVLDRERMVFEAEKGGVFRIAPLTHEKTFVAKAHDDKRMRYNYGKLDSRGYIQQGKSVEREVSFRYTL